MSAENAKGQGVSHASDSSVPESIQQKVIVLEDVVLHIETGALTSYAQVPKKVEDELPDAVHNTGSNKETGKVSHGTGPKGSIVPQVCRTIKSCTVHGANVDTRLFRRQSQRSLRRLCQTPFTTPVALASTSRLFALAYP